MVRPHKTRRVEHEPRVVYFKPQGVPLRALREVSLGLDELEALRLADLEGLSHEEAGERMAISRATFGRIVAQARAKVAEALVHGRAIRVEGGEVELADGPPGRGLRRGGGRHGAGRGPGGPPAFVADEETTGRTGDEEIAE